MLVRRSFLNGGVVHPSYVVGYGGQGKLSRHSLQSPRSELPHSPLLFQHSEHRFHNRLPLTVDPFAGWTSQSLPHPAVLRVALPNAYSCPCPEPGLGPSVRNPGFHPARNHQSLAPADHAGCAMRRTQYLRSGSLAFARHCRSTSSTIGNSESLSLACWVTRCAAIRWSSVTADSRRVSHHPSFPCRKNRASPSLLDCCRKPLLRSRSPAAAEYFPNDAPTPPPSPACRHSHPDHLHCRPAATAGSSVATTPALAAVALQYPSSPATPMLLPRVESMATCPSRPMPRPLAISNTWVNTSFNARPWRRRKALKAQLSGVSPPAR